MSPHDKQDAAGHEEGSPPAGTLVQRPAPGVIDATAAKRHYERSAGWLSRRFSTVDRLLSRFRSADDDGTGNPGFVFFERSDVHGNEPPVSGGSRAGSSTGTASGTEQRVATSTEPVRTAISLKEDDVSAAVPDIGNAGNKPDVQKNSLKIGVSGSIQRLVQRTASPGSVDVRPAPHQYGRIGEWIAKRSGLLNRLESRMMHGENKPERHARQAAFIDVRRKTAMLGPNPDDLRDADTGRAPADAAMRSGGQEGITLPGNGAIRWRYQQQPKDSPEAHGRIQPARLPAQASHAASPAEKNSPKNERPFPGPGYGAPKPDSPLPSPGNAPKADQLPSTGMFRLSRKRTPPVTGGSSSKDAQASGQNLPAASAAGRPEQGTGESISAASFSINAGPLNIASEPVQPKFREQGAMALAAKGTSSTSARENMILRKHGPERPAGNNRELGTAGTGTGESISAASFSITTGPPNSAEEPVRSKNPEPGTTPLAAQETSSTPARENMILRKHGPERPAGNNRELETAGTGGGEGISAASFSINAEPLNSANEPVQPKLPEHGTMPLASSIVLPDSKNRTSPADALISRATGRAALTRKPALPAAAVEARQGTRSQDYHAYRGLTTLFRKPVVSPEIQTKKHEAKPDPFYGERTRRFKSSPLSAADRTAFRDEALKAAGTLHPEQAPHIEPVRLMRSRASEKPERPGRPEESMAADGHEPGTAAAAELPAETSLAGKTEIIWRKAAQADEGRPFVDRGRAPDGIPGSLPADTLMRQASAPAPPQPEITTPGGTLETPAAEIDLDQLVEQVSRVIARRIDIEQERRGTRQWL